MRLIHVKLARSIWLFDIQDMNPKGRDILGDIVLWIKETYQFATGPNPDDPVPNAPVPPTTANPNPNAVLGLTFQRGKFKTSGDDFITINNLTIYDDGFVVDASSSTEDGDKFAADLIESAAKEFGLIYDEYTVRFRGYISELVFRSEMDFAVLSPPVAGFAAKLTDASLRSGRGLSPFSFGGVTFWTDTTDGTRQAIVRIERQGKRPFSDKRYFSDAPLQTVIHLGLLEDFENLAIGG